MRSEPLKARQPGCASSLTEGHSVEVPASRPGALPGAQFEQLKALRELSARLGRDPLLVQASSGNTSIKLEGILWIKASGKWLVNAEDADFLVPVDLAQIRSCLRENTTLPPTHQNSSGKRICASIEAGMHCVLPHKVVVHVHSVNTIAWALREDAPAQLALRLAGLHWKWIPYTPSGFSLAQKIEEILGCSPETDILVLGNHGLVVCGNSCDAAESLLAEIERRLKVEPRRAPEPNIPQLKQFVPDSTWSIPTFAGIHALATDHITRRILSEGVLYPCQAIFLPGSAAVLRSSADQTVETPVPENGAKRQPFSIIEERGVIVSREMTLGEREMLSGLAHIVQRIDTSAPIRYLTAAEIAYVLNNEADSYRQIADRGC